MSPPFYWNVFKKASANGAGAGAGAGGSADWHEEIRGDYVQKMGEKLVRLFLPIPLNLLSLRFVSIAARLLELTPTCTYLNARGHPLAYIM
jgi:hypothetical protein